MNYTRKTDYDTLYFNNSDDYVNLKNILADLIALAEPIKTLCKKECTGLCPTCGIEKTNSCNCNEHTNNDAWNKLKDLHFNNIKEHLWHFPKDVNLNHEDEKEELIINQA